jgi:hypothetical protein
MGTQCGAQLFMAGLGQEVPVCASNHEERRGCGHGEEREAGGLTGAQQGVGYLVVDRAQPETKTSDAVSSQARRVGAGLGLVPRQAHTRGQEQLSTPQVRRGIGELADVNPANLDVRDGQICDRRQVRTQSPAQCHECWQDSSSKVVQNAEYL